MPSVAEETGAIMGLGRSVLWDACTTVAIWQQEDPGPDPLTVSVNVSAVQLEQPGFVDDVRLVLAETGLIPASLTLELTETAFSRSPDLVAKALQELNDLDVELAVDDFGTGFSSLQHLQVFPIDMLKIPKPFIDDVGGYVDDSALARATIDIGHSLGLRVVAEGIERQEQLDRLVELGCRYGQGFLLGRPVSAERMRASLG